jgi:hypothetical protein
VTSHDPIDHPDAATEPEAAGAGRPATEPGPAVLRDDAPSPGPQAPDDRAPDMAEINSGDGPGVSPGE